MGSSVICVRVWELLRNKEKLCIVGRVTLMYVIHAAMSDRIVTKSNDKVKCKSSFPMMSIEILFLSKLISYEIRFDIHPIITLVHSYRPP
jgi:hypothetical protein